MSYAVDPVTAVSYCQILLPVCFNDAKAKPRASTVAVYRPVYTLDINPMVHCLS